MSLIFHASLNNNFSDVVGTVDGIPSNIVWKSTNRGLKPELNGANAKITYGNIGTVKTIAMWVHLRSTTESILDLNGTQTIDIASGTVRGNSWTSPTVYVDGAATASLSDLSGYHQIIITTATGIAASAVVAGLIGAAYGELIIDDIRGYDNELSAGDALSLYNATSGEYGVRVAELNYVHDPAAIIPVTDDTVMLIGGKLAGDAVDTISDRAGEGNDATIYGAMPADGFLGGGRRILNGNYVEMPASLSTQFDSDAPFTAMVLWKTENVTGLHSLFGRSGFHQELRESSGLFSCVNYDTSNSPHPTGGISASSNVSYLCVWKWTGSVVQMKVNTVSATDSDSFGGRSYTATPWKIGLRDTGIIADTQLLSVLINGITTDAEDISIFNTLAVLPFWSISYTDYPDNVTTYTDRFPHSSTIIASGTFKVDDDKITCTSAGTLTYSAANEFDGQEYITVTIAGTEYSGTGTITQGNATVSVAQGSNKITVSMGTADTITDILITFRATV